MNFDNLKSLTIPEGKATKISCNGTIRWQSGYKNWVRYSTEADGKTIYNGGLGYKDGYRVRSGGAEQGQDGVTITGYIPYKKGEVLYIYPPFNGKNTENTVNFYDDSFTCLGQQTDSGARYGICAASGGSCKTQVVNGTSVLDISAVTVSGIENVTYVRIGNNIYGGVITSGSQMIITKNEEIV